MKILGLTGGIGAGKSSVAKLFQQKGISVFNSDQEAKRLYTTSSIVKEKVIEILGEEAYIEQELDKEYVAKKVFSAPQLLAQLNAILHPEVKKLFEAWKTKQPSTFVVKEAAILFESSAYKQCDYILTVTADTEIRIKRVMQRDQISEYEVLKRIKNQWQETRKIELSDFVLYNNHTFEALQQEFEALYPEIEFKLTI